RQHGNRCSFSAAALEFCLLAWSKQEMRSIFSQILNRRIAVLALITSVATILFCLNSRAVPTALMQGSPTLADDFNDNSLDTAKWDPNNLFSGFTDTSLPIAETNQRLEIGPLLQNTGSS